MLSSCSYPSEDEYSLLCLSVKYVCIVNVFSACVLFHCFIKPKHLKIRHGANCSPWARSRVCVCSVLCMQLCHRNKYLRSPVCICMFVLHWSFWCRGCHGCVCIADVCHKVSLMKSPSSSLSFLSRKRLFLTCCHTLYTDKLNWGSCRLKDMPAFTRLLSLHLSNSFHSHRLGPVAHDLFSFYSSFLDIPQHEISFSFPSNAQSKVAFNLHRPNEIFF